MSLPSNFRGILAGCGTTFFGTKYGASLLLEMTGKFKPNESTKVEEPVLIAFIGTAGYDLDRKMKHHLIRLIEFGCDVREISVADPGVSKLREEDEKCLREDADIIFVSGGNSLYSIRRWEETGLDMVLKDIAITERGGRNVIFAGGSGGTICWFTSGHSGSAEPSTYLKATLLREADRGEEAPESTEWPFIRVRGLGVLPGMVCPHYDMVGNNKVEREEDFKEMIKRHPSERGVAIDQWAAILFPGDGTYEVVSVPGKGRENADSILDEGVLAGVYTLEVVPPLGKVQRTTAPRKGQLSDLLRQPNGPLVKDPFESFYAMANSTTPAGSLLT